MSHAELTRRIASITRREVNRAKAPAIAAALRTTLPGVAVTDKVGTFGAAEWWLMVDGEQVGAMASNHLWLATGHMHAVTELLGGRILPLDTEPRRWRGWVRVRFAESHDGVIVSPKPTPAVCPTHFEVLPMTGLCDRCRDLAA